MPESFFPAFFCVYMFGRVVCLSKKGFLEVQLIGMA